MMTEKERCVHPALDLSNGIITNVGTNMTYRIGKFLGKGGFARVHEVINLHNNVTYAAKIIPKSKMTRKYQIAKVAREIKIHKDLIHENVVKLELFFEDKVNAYIVLENCPNQSLVHLMKKKPCFSIQETRYYVKQLIAGTKYIHSKNIIHRDLKPGNMFLSEKMVVKIGDFGLAMSVTNMSEQPVLCGTPNYIAPEVLNKSSQSFAIDVWAIGCTIYCLMFGIPPYEAASLELTYERIKSNNWDKSKALYYPVLIDLLDRIFVLDPNERLTLKEIEKHIFFDAVVNELFLDQMHLNNSHENEQTIATTYNNNLNIKNNNFNNSYNLNITYNLIKGNLSQREIEGAEDSDKILISKRRTSTIKSSSQQQQNSDQPRTKKVSAIKKLVQNIFKKRNNEKSNSANNNRRIEENAMYSQGVSKIDDDKIRCQDVLPNVIQRPFSDTINLKEYCRALKISTNAVLLKVLDAICDINIYKGNDVPKIPEYNLVFVAKWVDYSNKYGFGYQLTNNSNGVLFNDNSSFIMRSNCSNFQYLDDQCKLHTFELNELPKQLEQKFFYLKYFKEYMDENLSDGAAVYNEQALSCMDNYENPIIKRWVRTTSEIIMELSDGTFQANFSQDHTKILLSFRDVRMPSSNECLISELANGIVITFINSNRKLSHYEASNLMLFRPGELLMKRLQYMRCVLSDFVKIEKGI